LKLVKLNKIYTKTGDNGDTALGDGQRVLKDSLRVNAYGNVDELNASIGVITLYATEDLKKKLKNIGLWINSLIPECNWKICVDSAPLLEKAWAEESGLGWIGKNSNLINKDYGSWLSLGFIILDQKLIPDEPSKPLCGQCDKCIDKCPTSAIAEPFVINSQLCIAYHTIENRSEKIPEKIKNNLNGWIAGCDICQDICPWNKSVPKNYSYEAQPRKWMTNLNQEALQWSDDKWLGNLKGSTLKRIKPWMWKRNIRASIQRK